MITMAAKGSRRGRPKSSGPKKNVLITFKGGPEFETWLEGLIEHCREEAGWDSIPVSSIVEQALICLARERRYKPEPPKR